MRNKEPKYPDHLSEIGIAVGKRVEFDFDADDFVEIGGWQIDISGSRKALRELGRYLIEMSEFESDDDRYHEHLEKIKSINSKEENEIIVRYPYK